MALWEGILPLAVKNCTVIHSFLTINVFPFFFNDLFSPEIAKDEHQIFFFSPSRSFATKSFPRESQKITFSCFWRMLNQHLFQSHTQSSERILITRRASLSQLAVRLHFWTRQNMCWKLKTAARPSCLRVAIKKFYVASGFVFIRSFCGRRKREWSGKCN